MKLPSACSWLALLSAAHAAIAAVGPLAHDDPLLNRSAVHARNAACATQNQCDGPRMARRRANALQARSGLVSRDQRNNPDNVFDSAHWNRLSYQNPNGGSWQQIYDCVFAGYSHHVSSTNGDSVTVYFSGTGFNLIGEARSSGGVGQVWVDDKVVALYDSYAPYGRPQYNLLTIDGLSDGGHKLVLKNNLIKGGPNGVGGGTTISFDALEVTRTTGEPAWTGIPITAAKRVGSRWGAWVKGDISSALWSTWGAGDYAQFTFTGTGFRVFTAGKSDGVYATVRLAPGSGSGNDPAVGYLNSWMPDTQLSLNNFAMEDLWPRTYTVSVVNTGKRPDGSGGFLNMDGIRYIDRSSTRQYIGADDSSIVTTGTWTTDTSIYGNGKARTTTQAGVQMTLTFTGTGISVIGERGPESGNYRILIDGNIIVWDINNEANTKAQWTLFQTHSLPPGRHTITVRSNDDSNGRRLRVTHFVVRGGSSGNVSPGGSVVPVTTTSTTSSSTSTSAPATTTTSSSSTTTSSTSTSTSAAPTSSSPANALMFEFTDASGKKTTANLGTSANQYRKQALGINSNATVVSVSGSTNGTYELVRSGLTSVIGAEAYIFGSSMGNSTDKCAGLVFGYDSPRGTGFDANSYGPFNGKPFITKAYSLSAPANGQQDVGLTWIDPNGSAIQMKFIWVNDDGVLVAIPASTPISQYQANCAWQFDSKTPFSSNSVRAARLYLQL